jgi:sulfite reductase beta subunit-like hemoprotein
MNDERLELLLAISSRTLGIESFELTGRQTLDLHVVNVEDLGRALEAAYDAGLLVGHRMGREESVRSA